jgi:tetratricopeptide (TPR) repeat protein
MRKNVGCALMIVGGLAILYEFCNVGSLSYEPNAGLVAVGVALGVIGIVMQLASWYSEDRAAGGTHDLNRHYLRMIFRRKWPLLLPVVLGVLAFFPLWAATPDKYRAVATVLRQDDSADATSPAAQISSESRYMEIPAIEADIFRPDNMKEVVVQTKEDVDLKTAADWQRKYEELHTAIHVESVVQRRGTDIIQFEVIHADPDVAQNVANAVAWNYVERSKSTQSSRGLRTIAFLHDETDMYNELLRRTEQELDDYRSKNFADLPEVTDGIRNRLLSLRIEQDSRRLQLLDSQSRREEAEAQLRQVKPTIQGETTSEPNPTVTDLKASLTQMEQSLQLLLTSHTENQPDVVHLRNQIAAIKEQLAKEPERINTSEKEIVNPQYQDLLSDVSRLNEEIKAGEAALRELSAGVVANEKVLADVVKQEKHYNDLLRDQSEYTELYTQSRRQLDEAQRRVKAQQEELGTRVELYSQALKPAIPYSQPAAKLALVCLVGGIAATLLLMFGLALSRRLFGRKDDQARPLYKRALAIREKALRPGHPDVATSLNNLAEFYRAQGQYAQAEPLYKRSLAILEKTLGPEHPHVAASLSGLAEICCAQGNYVEAEPLYRRSLAIREKALGPDHLDVATSLNKLAELYCAQGKYAEAEPLYKRALAISEKALGPDHPDVAASLSDLAGLYHGQGQHAQAEPLYKRSLAILEKALGPDHPDVATSLNNLAGLYCAQGQYAQAEPLYKRSLAIREKALGRKHADVATSLNNLAWLCYAQGQYAQAAPLYKRLLAILEKALGPHHPVVAASLSDLAGLYHDQSRYAEAEPLYKRSLAIMEKALGPDHPSVATSLEKLARLYRATGREEEAAAMEERAAAIWAMERSQRDSEALERTGNSSLMG